MIILAEREWVNNDLQMMEWDGGKGTKYILFWNSILDARLGALYINSMKNVEVKYEYITNINLSEKIEYQGKKMKFKEMILIIKAGGKQIFLAVEKEVGYYKQSAFLLMKPTKRVDTRV